ncbi:MAG: RtcB family protein [Candidatus Wildermuthbacteria bacterium]|nr:RtcB family protein [Candidatus Wildermuthbacteria bacterium]
MQKSDFVKLSEYLWEVPRSFRGDMRVAARLYASEKMLEHAFRDESIEQLVNLTTLPGIQKYSIGMPDLHEGYGSPIGGVAAIDAATGIISPGMVGYDQNCGMRLLTSQLTTDDIRPKLDALATEIQKEVPSGLGRGRQLKFDIHEMDKILEEGSQHLVQKGYGEPEDIENCEEHGQMAGADASLVSEHAKRRGSDQAGTLGSGNHFLEIQKVEQIFDEETARQFGLFQNQVVIMAHTGSRGLGHQNATDYIRLMQGAMIKYGIDLPDRELACVPFQSEEGQKYFGALACGLNFAWANRQMISHFVRKAWDSILGTAGGKLSMLYDIAHNTAKLEEHEVGGKQIKLIVHRKGSTRAFPGQLVFIPGSMGTASYVLVGVESGKDTFYSTCHGAGRVMSRAAAIRNLSAPDIVRDLKEKGIIVKCWSLRGIAEEAPQAYKNIDEVIDVVHNAGISKKVARLVPLAVVKGE